MLTNKQTEELHLALIDYLQRLGLGETLAAFEREVGLTRDQVQSERHGQLLEKKWTSVIRLQRKVMELEDKLKQMPAMLVPGGAGARLPRQIRHTMAGHRSTVNCLAFHPVYSLLASVSDDTSVKLWDYEAGDLERSLKGHVKSVTGCAFDSTGNFLITCSADLTLKVWDVQNDYKCIKTLHGHDHSVSFVSATNDHIYSCSRDKSIRQWELGTGYCTKTYHGHSDWVRMVQVSDDEKSLVSCSSDQTVRVWDIGHSDSKAELRGHEHVVECCTFVPMDAYSQLKDLVGGSMTATDKPGLYVVSGSRDKSIRLWDVSTEQCLFTFNGHDNWVRSLAWLSVKSGETQTISLLSASDDKTIKIWDLKTGRCTRTLEGHEHFVCYVASRSGYTASCGVDQSVRVWGN